MIPDFGPENKRPLLSHTLRARATDCRTWLCVGLDPRLDSLPAGVPRDATGVERFCLDIIDATRDLVPAFKLNFAFFEALGAAGWKVLERVRASVPSTTIAVADAKRGDIGSSSEAYAHAIFEMLQFDAVTVNPYLGWDALEPFLARRGTCAFILCKTSNPGASEYQDRPTDAVPLFMQVARDAAARSTPAEIGLVVGGTQSPALTTIRSEFPRMPLLVPGVGPQGADAADVMARVKSAALITVSRQILYASAGADFQRAAADETSRLARLCWSDDAV